jgi:hypothetical protein
MAAKYLGEIGCFSGNSRRHCVTDRLRLFSTALSTEIVDGDGNLLTPVA